ncbi:MAG: CehA/McbA family metallohydrolase [bacterium]|nr:CehA/McbA family metallohydrolase [bacterium]MCP5069975.1 CehA/McbA family metallohydrolase [bacterium]
MHKLILLALLVPTAAHAQLVAEQITAPRYEALRVGGPDAVAGVGDWAMGNGTLCAAISDPSHESSLSNQGGVLVDLGHCGRSDDQWTTLQPLVNLSQSGVVTVSTVRTEQSDADARVITVGNRDGIEVETTYTLGLAETRALGITTRITRREPGERFFAYGTAVLHPSGALRAFTSNRRHPEHSVGFEHPGGNPASVTSMIGALVAADLVVWVGSGSIGPPISYGLDLISAMRHDASGRQRPAPGLSVTGESFTLTGAFPRPFWLGSDIAPGLFELAQTLLMDLGVGDSLVLERRLWVGERADVASITDQLWADEPLLEGRVGKREAVVHVSSPGGNPISAVRTNESGAFRLRLPSGRYALRARGFDGLETRHEVDHRDPGQTVRLPLGPAARVHLPQGHPMRLVFVGENGTPDPRFGADQLGLAIDGDPIPTSLETNGISLAGSRGDPTEIAMRPGQYRVFAVRGPEHGLTTTRIELRAGEDSNLILPAPSQLFDTPGWISADLHVHSGWSFDSALPQPQQLRAFAAAAGEILVATEHDRTVDPRPAIEALGLSDRLHGVTGVEITAVFRGGDTPASSGHANAFPMREQPTAYRGGAPSAEGRRWRDVWADLRESGTPILQLNHPRSTNDPEDDESYLNHLGVGTGYDPSQPLDAAGNRALSARGAHGLRDLDFDAMELLNGDNHPGYRRTRADWFSFLLQGEKRTGTANSDSHELGVPVAFPRNYIRLADGPIDDKALAEAIRRGALWGTTGPLLDVHLGTADLGELHPGSDAELSVRIDAAPWIPVNEARVYVNGVLAESRPLEGPAELSFPLHFPADAFVTVEVEGEPSGAYAEVLPGFIPFAFTNPIYVDADRDGRWTSPGLP